MRLKSEKRQKNRKDGVYFRYLLQGLISDPTGGAIPVNRGCRDPDHARSPSPLTTNNHELNSK